MIFRITFPRAMFSGMFKAAGAGKGQERSGHKYLHRIPTGNPKRPWRYVYTAGVAQGGRGKYIGDEDWQKKGAKIKLSEDVHDHEGKPEKVESYAEITEEHEGKVNVKWSHSGKEEWVKKKDLADRAELEHHAAIVAHHERLKNNVRKVLAHGTAKQQERTLAHAAQFGIIVDGGFALTPDEHWGPPTNDAYTLHAQALPKLTRELPDGVLVMPNPDEKRGITKLKRHQAEGAARCLQSWDERDGFLLQDEAGLGKTGQAIAAMIAHGGKRNLIVVPGKGKKALKNSWQKEADRYNINIKNAEGTSASEEGFFIVSYDDLYKKGKGGKALLDNDGRPILKDEFKHGWDTTSFDECHNMASAGSLMGQAGVQLQEHTKKALYMSATPFTNLADLHYLRKMGWFKNGQEFVEWASKAGAQVRKAAGDGDLPNKIDNPKSPEPMVTFAAMMHVTGAGLKRQPYLTNLHNEFHTVGRGEAADSVSKEHRDAFNLGSEIQKIAVEHGADPFATGGLLSMWRKSYWEVAKSEHAFKIADEMIKEGRQVLFFTQFKNHADHDALRGLANMMERHADEGKIPDGDHAREGARKIRELIEHLPKVNLLQEIVKRYGGESNVAQIHGDAKTDASDEQQAYQDGHKKVAVATFDKGGTGLSFHDDQGIAARGQINFGFPWTGTQFQQVSYRSHRLGSKSATRMAWLMGDDASENNVAATVAAKLKTMGALVAGDPKIHVDPRMIANYEASTSDDPDDVIKALAEGKTSNDLHEQGHDEEHANTIEAFNRAVAGYKAGRDVLAEQGDRLINQRLKDADAEHRRAVAQLIHAPGIKVTPGAEKGSVEVHGATEGSEAYKHLRAISKSHFHLGPEGRPQWDKSRKVWTLGRESHVRSLADRLGTGGVKTKPVPSWSHEDFANAHASVTKGMVRRTGKARSFTALVKAVRN